MHSSLWECAKRERKSGDGINTDATISRKACQSTPASKRPESALKPGSGCTEKFSIPPGPNGVGHNGAGPPPSPSTLEC